jgi:hypothetical protein
MRCSYEFFCGCSGKWVDDESLSVRQWMLHQQIRQKFFGIFQAGQNVYGILLVMRPYYEAAPEMRPAYKAL